jgi:hypothetical protein
MRTVYILFYLASYIVDIAESIHLLPTSILIFLLPANDAISRLELNIDNRALFKFTCLMALQIRKYHCPVRLPRWDSRSNLKACCHSGCKPLAFFSRRTEDTNLSSLKTHFKHSSQKSIPPQTPSSVHTSHTSIKPELRPPSFKPGSLKRAFFASAGNIHLKF